MGKTSLNITSNKISQNVECLQGRKARKEMLSSQRELNGQRKGCCSPSSENKKRWLMGALCTQLTEIGRMERKYEMGMR